MKSSHSQDQSAANLFRILTLVGVVALAAVAHQSFQSYMEDQRQLSESHLVPSSASAPLWLLLCEASAFAAAAAGFLISLISGKRPWGQVASLTFLCFGVFLAWLAFEMFHDVSGVPVSKTGERPSAWTGHVQRILLGSLILSPPVAWLAYLRSSLLDRYLVQAVATPLIMCFAGFLSIWLIIDLTDNGKDFMIRGAGVGMLGYYYLVQLPQMVLMVLPVTLLLSLLFALGKLSQANEVISMMGAGRSLFRILYPVLAIGLYGTLISVVLNYRWAPEAEARKEGLLNKLEDIKKQSESAPASPNDKAKGSFEQFSAVAWMYANSLDRRFWFVGRVPVDLANAPMRYVAIWCQNQKGAIEACYKADSVTWDFQTREWILKKAKVWLYDPFGIATITRYDNLRIPGWRETPWHVVSASYKAECLGIPELTTYIRTNSALPHQKLAPYRTHWHFAWSEPFRCLFIVLMASPLGVVHARRGVLGGVAASIGIFFGLMFFDSLFLGLGQSGRIAAWLGAWIPNVLLGCIGGTLLYLRNADRKLPSIPNPFK